MKLTREMTDDAVLAEVGVRLERTRLDRNLSQQQLADEAGVSRHSLLRIEAGRSVTLPVLLRVLRALDLLDGLEVLVPEPLPSPIEQLERQGHRRQRASTPRSDDDNPTWRWGTP
jgi:putative transcriptional regulator